MARATKTKGGLMVFLLATSSAFFAFMSSGSLYFLFASLLMVCLSIIYSKLPSHFSHKK